MAEDEDMYEAEDYEYEAEDPDQIKWVCYAGSLTVATRTKMTRRTTLLWYVFGNFECSMLMAVWRCSRWSEAEDWKGC